MRKIRLLFPVLVFITIFGVGCGNSGSDTTSTTDTTVIKDTISRNPENFSNPH